jgi:hypothetical protein
MRFVASCGRRKKWLHRALFSVTISSSAVTNNDLLDMMNAHQKVRDAAGPDPSGIHRLSGSFPGFLGSPVSAQNADKTRTKCGQNRGCEFVSDSASTTCNFTAVKCLHFRVPSAPNFTRNHNPCCPALDARPSTLDKAGVSIRGCWRTKRRWHTGQNETFETETACATATLLRNTQTILRPVSFCPVHPPTVDPRHFLHALFSPLASVSSTDHKIVKIGELADFRDSPLFSVERRF